jgi:hypothetical protein
LENSTSRAIGLSGGLPSSIAEAIADHADIPPEYARFVNIEYHGIRLATMAVADMQSHARELASELVRMSEEVHQSEA